MRIKKDMSKKFIKALIVKALISEIGNRVIVIVFSITITLTVCNCN